MEQISPSKLIKVKSYYKIALSIGIIFIIALILWPFINGRDKQLPITESLLTERFLGDGTPAIVPIPENLELDPLKVKLGKKLFFDTRLSNNGFSCATCHPVDRGGMDGLKLSMINGGGFDVKNTPTVFNSGFNSMQHWNGEIDSLEQQVARVILDPQHMNSSWQLIISRLQKDAGVMQQFRSIYANGLSVDNIMNALATYERSLITPGADFDRYLRGDMDAITPDQKKGYALFQQYGCISCHQGINVGGNLLAKFGIFKSHQERKKELTEYDFGRYLYTRNSRDKFVFRVPSLRNVSSTAPYFHDGSAATLRDAIRIMARIQLGITLADHEIGLIESFLHSLSGQYNGIRL